MAIPTLSEIKSRLKSDLIDATEITIEARRNVTNYILNSLAGVTYSSYRYIDSIFRTYFPPTATTENLDNWGQTISLPRIQATTSQLRVRVTLQTAPINPIVIPQGTEFQSVSSLGYSSNVQTTVSTTTTEFILTSLGTGTQYNLAVDSSLTFINPIAGLPSSVSVVEVTSTAQDTESDSNYASRIQSFFSKSAYKTGSFEDYIEWANASSTLVARSWVINRLNNTAGHIGVYVTKSADLSASEVFSDFTDTELASIKEYVNERRPLPSDLSVFNPTFVDLDFTVSLSNNIESNRELVTNALKDFLFRNVQLRGSVIMQDLTTVQTGSLNLSSIISTVVASVPSSVQANVVSPASLAPLTLNGQAYNLGMITFQDI